MELQFISPELRKLDEKPLEVLAGCVFADERPPRGVAGLVDWRLAGRLERLLETGFLTGALDEVMLLPGRPRLGADKVLLFGLGSREGFGEMRFDRVVDRMLTTIAGLCVRAAIVELPGRHCDAISSEIAADRFLEAAGRWHGAFDTFVVVEKAGEQRRIAQRMVEERRRVRSW